MVKWMDIGHEGSSYVLNENENNNIFLWSLKKNGASTSPEWWWVSISPQEMVQPCFMKWVV